MEALDTFDLDMFGEIPAADVAYAYNNAHIGLFEEEDPNEEKPIVNAKRYFTSAEEVI